jgi:hypothetical protein
VLFTENTPFKSKKELFLAISEYKQTVINILSKILVEKGCSTIHASDDVDVLIVKTTVESGFFLAKILICYYFFFHFDLDSNDIVSFKPTRASSTTIKICDIRGTTSTLGLDACNIMPFVQVISGCDTTSQKLRMDQALFKRF